MGVLGIKLMLETPWIGFASLTLLSALPACRAVRPRRRIGGRRSSPDGRPASRHNAPEISIASGIPHLVLPSWPEVWRSFQIAVLPQLSLTLTERRDRDGEPVARAFPRQEGCQRTHVGAVVRACKCAAVSFGAMPMCHGAGGLAAQFRFGARTGLAPIIFGGGVYGTRDRVRRSRGGTVRDDSCRRGWGAVRSWPEPIWRFRAGCSTAGRRAGG